MDELTPRATGASAIETAAPLDGSEPLRTLIYDAAAQTDRASPINFGGEPAWKGPNQEWFEPFVETVLEHFADVTGWRAADDYPLVGGTYDVGGYVKGDTLPGRFVRGYATLIHFEDGPKWLAVRGGDVLFNVEYWFEAPPHPERERAQRKASDVSEPVSP